MISYKRSNMVAHTLAALVALSTLAGHAHADVLREPVSCSAVAKGLDSKDQRQIGYVVQYVVDILTALDDAYVQRKRPSMVKDLSDDGMLSTVAMVAVQCRKNLVASAREAAKTAYEGIRAMQSDLGVRR